MKNIIEFLSKNIIFIFSILIIFIIIYLLYRTTKMEKFAVTTASNNMNDLIKKAVNDQYSIDISAMRNLGSIANNILTNKDILNIPSFNVNMNAIHLANNNPVDTTIFTRYMVIPWAGSVNNIPRGWVLCDGNVYNIDNINNYLSDQLYTNNINKVVLTVYTVDTIEYKAKPSNYVITPNLIGKFICGAGSITINSSNYPMYTMKINADGLYVAVNSSSDLVIFPPGFSSGSVANLLTKVNIPPHNHGFYVNMKPGYTNSGPFYDTMIHQDGSTSKSPRVGGGWQAPDGYDAPNNRYGVTDDRLSYTNMGNGLGTVPVNNMPPFYVLTYIMKL